jgi:hypothetical protein
VAGDGGGAPGATGTDAGAPARSARRMRAGSGGVAAGGEPVARGGEGPRRIHRMSGVNRSWPATSTSRTPSSATLTCWAGSFKEMQIRSRRQVDAARETTSTGMVGLSLSYTWLSG